MEGFIINIVDLIIKKRDKNTINEKEIDWIIENFVNGTIPDYQISSLLMAIFLNGMNNEETIYLTNSIIKSGKTINLEKIKGKKVDKHSTGGVGDKTTLILAPLVASLNIPVAKLSGKSLGHTGGTIDKLESIGVNTSLKMDDFINQVNDIKISIAGQTSDLAPADKLLYALRDVTGTIDSIPLIASSIMSKKIASGSDSIVLDVKVGAGAFMKNIDDAKKLAKCMVNIGKGFNKKTTALLTNMSQPLGYSIGNSLEVKEAIEVLNGKGTSDLVDLVIELGAHMVKNSNELYDYDKAKTLLKENLKNGKALNVFKKLVEAQGGDINIFENLNKLEENKNIVHIKSSKQGIIQNIDAYKIAGFSMNLGAGRVKKDDEIDLNAGIVLNKKQCDKVSIGETLATIYTNKNDFENIIKGIENSFEISNKEIKKDTLIFDIIE